MDIGLTTEAYLQSHIEDGKISDSQVNTIRETCSAFWVEAALQARKRLPLDNLLLQCLGWLVPGRNSTASQVIELAKCLPNIVPAAQLPQLKREYVEFQCTPVKVDDEIEVDTYWHSVPC